MGDVRTPVHPSLDTAKADLSNALAPARLSCGIEFGKRRLLALSRTSDAACSTASAIHTPRTNDADLVRKFAPTMKRSRYNKRRTYVRNGAETD